MTLAHSCAGADKTLVVQDGDAALPTGALAMSFVEQARSRATPDLERERVGSRQLRRNAHQLLQSSGDLQQPSHPTFEQAIRPFRHWQVLQSSSHLAPSGITLPMVMQGLPETERRTHVSGRTFLSCRQISQFFTPSLLGNDHTRGLCHVIKFLPGEASMLSSYAGFSHGLVTCLGQDHNRGCVVSRVSHS